MGEERGLEGKEREREKEDWIKGKRRRKGGI